MVIKVIILIIIIIKNETITAEYFGLFMYFLR